MWSAVPGTPARVNHPANISRSLRCHILKQSCFQPVTAPAGIAEDYVKVSYQKAKINVYGRLFVADLPLPLGQALKKVVLAAARARGRVGRAPRKLTTSKLRLAMAAMGQRETVVGDLCRELG